MNNYDGKERRKDDMRQEERDLLIRMDEKLSNLITSFKILSNDFNAHALDDKKQFSVFYKFMWGFSGAFALLMLILKTIK